MIRSLSAALLGLALSSASLAEEQYLKLCNKTDETIRKATGVKWVRPNLGWESTGWAELSPGECDIISWWDTKYFYAETLDGSRKWRPSKDRKKFCVDFDQDFQIWQKDCRNPDVEFGLFEPWQGTKTINLK